MKLSLPVLLATLATAIPLPKDEARAALNTHADGKILERHDAAAASNPRDLQAVGMGLEQRSQMGQEKRTENTETQPRSDEHQPQQRRDDFSEILDQYIQLQEETLIENVEEQQAEAFWNPLESIPTQI